jgi:DNA-binding NarL/FixJ family response regulator
MHILIADDHAVVRRGLREILADALPGADFSEAVNGDEVLSQLGKSQIAMLVLDISMPGRSGMDVLRDVKHTYPRLPVIILSCQPEDQYAVRCLRAGAAAYINKESAPEELAMAAKKILSGGRYVSASLAEKLVANLDESVDKPLHELLSDREYEVMRMIAAGVPLTDWRQASCQCKNDQQLSNSHYGKNANEEQRRPYPLRHDARPDRLGWPVGAGITLQTERNKPYKKHGLR